MQNVWIIIWRFNPLHIWHISLINKSIITQEKTIIIIWSANKNDEKNPYSKEQRTQMMKNEFWNKIILDYLNDFKQDKDWIFNLNNLILSKNIQKEDNLFFFWWDLKNDYAIQVINRFKNFLSFKNIFFDEKPRNEIPISATIVRKLIKENNLEETKKWLSEKTTYLILDK